MSLVTVSAGRAWNSFHVHRLGSSISPSMVKVHWSRLTRGVGPADSTGKSVTTYWPGGTRELDAVSRRRPLNPLETNPIRGKCYLARILLFFGVVLDLAEAQRLQQASTGENHPCPASCRDA